MYLLLTYSANELCRASTLLVNSASERCKSACNAAHPVQTEASYSIIMSVSSQDVYSMAAHRVSAQHGRTQCQHPRLRLHYRLLTLCPHLLTL